MSPSFRHLLFIIVLLAAIIAALKAWVGSPLPFVDIFLFKEAGARLALDGVFHVRNLPHMEHDELRTYAYYVPVYPFLYGIWASFFGVNLPASIAFDQLIKLIRTLLLCAWIWPSVKPFIERNRLNRFVLLVGLLAFALLPFHSDRPDDLALCFGLLGILLPQKSRGFFLGLAAATSPAAAVFFGALYLIELEKGAQLFRLVFSSLLTFVALLAPIMISDPEAAGRFFQQIPLSTRPLATTSWVTFLLEWQKTFWYAGKEILVGVMVFAGLFLGAIHWRKVTASWVAMGAVSVAFAILSSVVWSYQVRYLWFPYVILFGLLVQTFFRQRIILTLLCLFPILGVRKEFDSFKIAVRRNASAVTAAKVEASLLPESRLAISADHYFTFRAKREVDLAHYVCRSLAKYDFIFLSKQTVAANLEPPCRKTKSYFELVEDFGEEGVLFRRKMKNNRREIASVITDRESTPQ